MARWDWSSVWKKAPPPAVAVVASVGCFALTVPAYSYNTLAKTAEYAAAHAFRARAVVVTEQSIGDLISSALVHGQVRRAVPAHRQLRHHLDAPICSPVSPRGTPRSTN